VSKRALDKLGQMLVKELRDLAILHFETMAAGRFRARPLRRMQDRVGRLTDAQRRLVRECVISAVDCGLDAFLQAVQLAEYKGMPITVGGKPLNTAGLALDARLTRWIAKYSKYPD
jgi:hypothetical protein